jgi:hypothetical protein
MRVAFRYKVFRFLVWPSELWTKLCALLCGIQFKIEEKPE